VKYGLFRYSFPHPNQPQGGDDAYQVVADIGQFEASADDEFLVNFVEKGINVNSMPG